MHVSDPRTVFEYSIMKGDFNVKSMICITVLSNYMHLKGSCKETATDEDPICDLYCFKQVTGTCLQTKTAGQYLMRITQHCNEMN